MVVFFATLCKNINHFPIPNGDVFQYIYDGRQYTNFKLPSNITTTPPPRFPPYKAVGHFDRREKSHSQNDVHHYDYPIGSQRGPGTEGPSGVSFLGPRDLRACL